MPAYTPSRAKIATNIASAKTQHKEKNLQI